MSSNPCVITYKTTPPVVTKWSLVGLQSQIRVHFYQKILPGAERGRSHFDDKFVLQQGFYNVGTTVDLSCIILEIVHIDIPGTFLGNLS